MDTKQFPNEFLHEEEKYQKFKFSSLHNLQQKLIKHPYQVYCLIEEIENEEPTLFLVLYTEEMANTVILFDVSRQINSTLTTDLDVIAQGFLETLDVGYIKRFPLCLYLKE